MISTFTGLGGAAEISILVGGTVQPFRFRGDGRPFVAGEPGQTVAVRVKNRTTVRLEVLVSLDGRSILADEPADLASSRGLVLATGAVYDFKVWRLNDETGREIILGSVSDAIATQATGSSEGVGVIGIATWRERSRPQYSYQSAGTPYRKPGPVGQSMSYTSDPSESMLRSRQQVGLGAGDTVSDYVGRTNFTRDSASPEVTAIGYDTAAALDERHIVLYYDPEPFSNPLSGYQKYRPVT